MSLRLRLFLAVALVIVVHTGVRIGLLAQNARDSARVAQQVQGEWVGKSLANTLTNPFVANDLATVQSTVELLFSEKAFLKLAVLDDRGRTIIDLRPGAGKIETKSPAWFTVKAIKGSDTVLNCKPVYRVVASNGFPDFTTP